ncbi:MAG: leucyl aminopeptidase [Hyphomicrobium sp.]|nr:leucyl aminopeptidase [Hyphomicrobium sp.]
MTDRLEVVFSPLTAATENVAVAFVSDELALGSRLKDLNAKSGGAVLKAAEAGDFKGKAKSTIEILAPPKLDVTRLIVIGTGKAADLSEQDRTMLGGTALGLVLARKCASASFIAEIPDSNEKADLIAADVALGALLRHYTFKKYLTRKSSSDDSASNGPRDGLTRLVIHTADPDKARTTFLRHKAIADGVYFARDLVNEPANVLGPVEFAERVRDLERVGVEVEILDVPALEALKMGSLLCVGQGSVKPSRVAIMQWNGSKSKRARPICFVGKGVTFDTGGISIKPAAGMEDMKGDMGGAACVSGLMLTLAQRKANVNVVGLIGCVENMPSGSSVRPGDIVTSMSGQTIEVLNTDAEGRLVLADVLWYAQERFKPKLIVDLATLTGAIMVALGKDFAGVYCNDDKLFADLQNASAATGEKIWRMPLDKSFDKLIDSKNADVKNIGGRWGGACTAAAFLHRFVKDTPWAHIDVAGTAMDATRTDISQSWASGWGVRLLDKFVGDNHEKPEK